MDEYLNLSVVFTRQNVVCSSFTSSFETQIKKREILAVLLIGRAAREILFDQSESSGWWRVIGIEYFRAVSSDAISRGNQCLRRGMPAVSLGWLSRCDVWLLQRLDMLGQN